MAEAREIKEFTEGELTGLGIAIVDLTFEDMVGLFRDPELNCLSGGRGPRQEGQSRLLGLLHRILHI
jgi:hypothetical protein